MNHPTQDTQPIAFKPLHDSDLNLLCLWFDKPHVKDWWTDHLSHTEIKEKYSKRIGSDIIAPFIVYLKNKPIGIIQYYFANKVGNN